MIEFLHYAVPAWALLAGGLFAYVCGVAAGYAASRIIHRHDQQDEIDRLNEMISRRNRAIVKLFHMKKPDSFRLVNPKEADHGPHTEATPPTD